MIKITIPEADIQVAVVQYLEILEKQWKVLWFTWSGNWQWQQSAWVKAKMAREWIRPGMPDLMICFRKRIIFIELKSDSGKPTDWQKKAISAINTVWDATGIVSAYLAYSFSEAKAIIDKNI